MAFLVKEIECLFRKMDININLSLSDRERCPLITIKNYDSEDLGETCKEHMASLKEATMAWDVINLIRFNHRSRSIFKA